LADGHRLTTPEYFELVCQPSSVTPRYVIPKGTDVRAYYTKVSSSAVTQVTSLYLSSAYSILSGTVEANLAPSALMKACEAALEDGHPDNWRTLAFLTRDTAYQRGQTLQVSISSPAESGGTTIAGTYYITSVDIDGLRDMADALGPVRRVTAQSGGRRGTLARILRKLGS
jgi:hypothetical protein